MTTLREFAMLQFMNSVTDKLDWHTKVGFPASVHNNVPKKKPPDRSTTPKSRQSGKTKL